MKTVTLIVCVVAAVFVVPGCNKDAETRKKMASICTRSSDMLAHEGSTMDDGTFRLSLQNALRSCSAACDLKDDPSCASLKAHVENLCRAAASACASFCQEAKGSLKAAACGQPHKAG